MLGKSGKRVLAWSADCRSMIINLKTPVMANAYAAAHELYSELHQRDSDRDEGAVLASDISLGQPFKHSTPVRQASSTVPLSGDQQPHQP